MMQSKARMAVACAGVGLVVLIGVGTVDPGGAGASTTPTASQQATAAAKAAQAARTDASRASSAQAAARSDAARAAAATNTTGAQQPAAAAAISSSRAAAASRDATARAKAAAKAAAAAQSAAKKASARTVSAKKSSTKKADAKEAAAANASAKKAAAYSKTAAASQKSTAASAAAAARYAAQARMAVASLASACGGQAPKKSNGTPYTCSFDDEFNGSTLDPKKWQVLTTSSYGFHSGPECYVNDGQHVKESAGVLDLILTRSTNPVDCTVEQTRYLSGMVDSTGLFAQAYGRFEVRAKLPPGIGLQPALWMFPESSKYGAWPNSGEIDIAEAFGLGVNGLLPGLLPDEVWPHLHYQSWLGPAAPGAMCDVPGSTTSFHTYAVDWTPQLITFLYDGKSCASYTWTPAGTASHAPEPFDQPFFISLELALGSLDPDLVSDLLTPFPSTLAIDYVRVWK
jgi:beta-glucanase (GH16 family)